MRTHNRPKGCPTIVRVVAAWLATCWVMVHPCSAQMGVGTGEVHIKDHGFRIKAAPKWTRLSDAATAALDGDLGAKYPGRTWRLAACWTKGDSETLRWPYVMVEVTEHEFGTMTFADIEKAFRARTRPDLESVLASPPGQMIKRLAEDDPVLDRARKRVVNLQRTEIDNHTLTELVIGHLGSRRAAHIVMASEKNLFDMYADDFKVFADSFKWDFGNSYEEPAKSTQKKAWTNNRGGNTTSSAGASSSENGGQAASSPWAKGSVKLAVLAAVVVLGVIGVVIRKIAG